MVFVEQIIIFSTSNGIVSHQLHYSLRQRLPEYMIFASEVTLMRCCLFCSVRLRLTFHSTDERENRMNQRKNRATDRCYWSKIHFLSIFGFSRKLMNIFFCNISFQYKIGILKEVYELCDKKIVFCLWICTEDSSQRCWITLLCILNSY